MADQPYQTQNFLFKSRGVSARYVDDTLPEGTYLNLNALEEIEESGLASRLGTTILSKSGTTAEPLGGSSGVVHSISKLSGLNGNQWRYASSAGKLYRLAGLNPGAYTQIATNLSGNPWMAVQFQSPASSYPYLFIADSSVMLKDNGTLAAPQNMGILQNKYPVQAQSQLPDEIVLDAFQTSSYSDSGFASFTPNQSLLIATLASPVTSTGIQAVNISTSGASYTTGGESTSLSESTTGDYTQSSSSTSPFSSVPMSAEDVVDFSVTVQATLTVSGTGGASIGFFYSIDAGSHWIGFAGYGGSSTGSLAPTVVNGTASGMTNLNQLIFKCMIDAGVGAPVSSVAATAQFGTVTAGIVFLTGTPFFLYQSLVIDTGGFAETVLVLQVTPTGFVADFTKTHAAGADITEYYAIGTVAASTTAIVSKSFTGTPISGWPTTLQQEDYIALLVYVSDPNAIQSITLQFNTSNGAYFYRTIGQGPLQAALNASTDSSTAAADAVLSDTLGVYTSGPGGVTSLNTIAGWTPILLQLSDFSGAGGADFNDPVMNWSNVTGYQITIVTGEGLASTSFPISFEMSSLLLVGGAGPDSFAGVSYDYMVTLFNINDYTESNPTMVMTDVNPPLLTNRVLPRRQPVLLSWTNSNTDTQATHWRVYRRGGTLGDNYRRIDQIPITAATGGTQTYTDIWSDLQIQQADTISFTNDVPVTSSLPVPVNTTLSNAIGTPGVAVNSVQTITPVSMTSISVNQQVDLGNVAADNFEVVIVISITGTTFNAFVQNAHLANEPVAATASYAQPVDIIAVANDIGYYAGDSQNPSYLYISASGNIQAVGSASYLPVSVPSDAITAIVNSSGNIFVSTLLRWWALAPAAGVGGSSTVYPSRADHGCVGKLAWVLRDGVVFYMGQDGIRTFVAGNGEYISELIEFIWQNTGPTPIPIADPAYFSNIRFSTWNRWVFVSYRALDGNTYRIVLDVDGKRYRNDSLDAQSMYLEQDTNQLVWGDSQGLVHLDRQLTTTDETNSGGTVVDSPIAITLQTPYNNMGSPAETKQWNELTMDCNTNGNPITLSLLFDDGETTEVIGTVTTTQRQRVNLNINNGLGFTGYKVSLQITGSGTQRIYLFQAAIRYVVLAKTRQSLDTYWRKFSTDQSKVAKDAFIEYTAEAPVTMNVYYDGSSTPGPGFPKTLPQYSGVRNALRVRLPAVKFRLLRMVLTSTEDFQVWDDSFFTVKPLQQGSGYEKFPLVSVET